MAKGDIVFTTLGANGGILGERTISRADIGRCPHLIMVADHYRPDGSCKCTNAAERTMMISEWGYTEADFDQLALRD